MLEICTSLASSSYKIQTLDSVRYKGQISLKLSQEMGRIWYSGLSLNTFSAPTMCQPLLRAIPEQTAALTFWSSWSGLGQRGRVMMGQTKLFSTLSICPSIHFSNVRGALLHCFCFFFHFECYYGKVPNLKSPSQWVFKRSACNPNPEQGHTSAPKPTSTSLDFEYHRLILFKKSR